MLIYFQYCSDFTSPTIPTRNDDLKALPEEKIYIHELLNFANIYFKLL